MLTTTIWTVLLLFLSRANSAPLGTELENRVMRITAPAGFSQVLFLDDFSSQEAGALPSSSKWNIDTGTSYPGGPAHWGTNEIQTYTDSPANIAITPNGTLRITPLYGESSGKSKARGGWTSARIETTAAHNFSCQPGARLRMEATLRVGSAPAAAQMGIWPAFWSLGAAFRGHYEDWPRAGEIDILETLNGAPTVWQTVHCGTAPAGGPCHETDGIGATAPLSRGGQWHTVAVEIDRTNAAGDWREETITWFVDGDATFHVSGAVVGDLDAWTSLARAPRFLLLNVACGGSFPDAVARTRTPTSQTAGGEGSAMEVKYVAVFST
ncbi:hypothetical protein VTK73DRAFT_5820 [Phialemonium thermophilum]|uniref:GH16 domain-containing protein n=1 Tax=Phialemonium thermophilum TaxID=223376 RepID=A0ABR3WM01_9PEZI